MDYHKDFEELCSLLSAKHVDFLIVGGYAVAFHGAPRFTGDLDILVRPSPEHVDRVLDALRDFGFPGGEVTSDDLLQGRQILQLGQVPVQVHIMTGISGVTWETAWNSKSEGTYGRASVFFIGREILVRNKRAAGRMKDLADIEALGADD